MRLTTVTAVVAAVLGAGCGDLLSPPLASAPERPVPSVVEARLVVARSEGPRSPPGAPPLPPAAAPPLAVVMAALRSSDVRVALGDALGTAVDDAPSAAVSVGVREEDGGVILVVQAPDRGTALAGCHAWLSLAAQGIATRDPAEGWLVDESARLTREIGSLDRQLSLLPIAPSFSPHSREEALTSARTRRLEAKVASGSVGASALASFPLPRALVRLRDEVRRDELEQRARGLGDQHPDVRGLVAQGAFYAQRLDAQWVVEAEAARRVEDAVLALPIRAERSVVARSLAQRLRAVDIVGASSLDPTSLQVIAMEHARTSADDAALAVHLGAHHPRREVVRARLDALARVFASERDTLATLLERNGEAASDDARGDELRDKAARLASIFARLQHYRESASPPRWTLASPCHVR